MRASQLRACLSIVAICLAGPGLSGCGGAPSVEPPPLEVEEVRFELPPRTSPGTLAALGPHLWEASFDRRGDRQGIQRSSEVVSRLVWAELDHYQFLQIANGRLIADERRVGRELYRRSNDESPYRLHHGVPGDSIILLRSLQLWEEAIAPFGDQLAFERGPDAVLEGRPVRSYTLRLAPAPAPVSALPVGPEVAASKAGRVSKPVALNGSVAIDEETGNRLLVELEGRYVPRAIVGGNDPTDEVLVTYRESRSLTGVPLAIEVPKGSQVIDFQNKQLRPTAASRASSTP